MVATLGLVGARPTPSLVARVTSPPYDVIKPGTPLWRLLEDEPLSLFHVILGTEPAAAFERLRSEDAFVEDDEPAYYVYEQRYEGPDGRDETRLGVFVAAEVTPTRPSRSSGTRRPSTTRSRDASPWRARPATPSDRSSR